MTKKAVKLLVKKRIRFRIDDLIRQIRIEENHIKNIYEKSNLIPSLRDVAIKHHQDKIDAFSKLLKGHEKLIKRY